MFERFTEKARRVVFFARFEASQYGSPSIETEHLLLGLFREDKQLPDRFLKQHGSIESIRKEIESRITIRKRISTSVEVPLSQECKRILNLALEEADQLGHRHVGTEHLLLAILREEECLAAQLLLQRGLRLDALRDEIQRFRGGQEAQSHEIQLETRGQQRDQVADLVLLAFRLAQAWAKRDARLIAAEFHEEGQFVDPRGDMRMGREDIEKGVGAFFASLPLEEQTAATVENFQLVERRSAIAEVFVRYRTSGANAGEQRIHLKILLGLLADHWALYGIHCSVAKSPGEA
jgi:uncharacterized protein (TIGR02246 family)